MDGDWLYPDKLKWCPDVIYEIEQRNKLLHKSLGELSAREKIVLELYFGLDGDMDFSFEEIGELYTVTRERIRQIAFKAIDKMFALNHGGDLEELFRSTVSYYY
jgi:DNA-directed RNA polymerase sigma subunit (sigma70/sigma32)